MLRRCCGGVGWLGNSQSLQLHLVEFESAQTLGEILQSGFLLLPAQISAQRQVPKADEDDEESAAIALGCYYRDDK
jgi:hypothetical protein